MNAVLQDLSTYSGALELTEVQPRLHQNCAELNLLSVVFCEQVTATVRVPSTPKSKRKVFKGNGAKGTSDSDSDCHCRQTKS